MDNFTNRARQVLGLKHLLVISNRVIANGAYFSDPKALELYLDGVHYDILLFAFWSHKVPDFLLKKYKVYGMHTGPLLDGKGKGGSPIDNLKALGVQYTTLCVFEMTNRIDEGKVILAEPLDISDDKSEIICRIDREIPDIEAFLLAREHQINIEIPERFKRI